METFPAATFELMPVQTIKDIFDTTQSGRAKYGVVPFENSTNGSVVFTLDHFADRSNLYPDLNVCREIYLDVHHCILGHIPSPSADPPAPSQAALAHTQALRDSPLQSGQCTPTPTHPNPEAPRARPLHPLSHVRRVYSHPQAFGQCTRFLSTYLRGIETVDVSSTSRAAELAKADASGASAAISSAVAARLLGLDVLASEVEDREDNTTRFFVLRRGSSDHNDGAGAGDWHPEIVGVSCLPSASASAPASVPSPDPDLKPASADTGKDVDAEADSAASDVLAATKSLVSFTVPHRHPGALADVLSCFRAYGLNLTSISSRPSLAAPFQYVFFVEFEGHRFEDPQGRVRGALRGVADAAAGWRWLGSWENMRRGLREE
ncbi:PDT domain-containing protein [Xylariaceae sp. FL0016]|nr:PDT domain-containing protein [Xylariaceae sp. FL0016]